MNDNIFMISDASYSNRTKCAGLGVIDLHTGKKYSHSICNIKNSHHAEYRALLLSVRIAIENGYDNVVFVYDNKGLNLDTLKLWLVGKIHSYQFLWLKRVFVNDADKLAKKARVLYEKLHISEVNKPMSTCIKKKKNHNNLQNQTLIEAIRLKPVKQIANFCSHIASKEEKNLIDSYFNNKKSKNYTPTKNGVDTLMLLCHLLPKNKRKNFFLFVKNKMEGKEYTSRLIKGKPTLFYMKRINKILSILQA